MTGEQESQVKHEYSGGLVYAMAGASREHNLIAGNIYAAFLQHLRSGPCRPFISDVKVLLTVLGGDVSYYPDVMVGCDPRDTHRLYLRYPKLIVEVSSESTERLDRREKLWAYQSIQTLEDYLIASQQRSEVTLFTKAGGWTGEILNQPQENIFLKSIALTLPLALIYQGVNLEG